PARGGLRDAGDRYDHRLAWRRATGGAPPESFLSQRRCGLMLYHLLWPLYEQTRFILFNLFGYVTFRAAGGMATALFISLALGPRVIRWLRRLRVGQVVREEGPQSHLQKAGTPTMGGALIIMSTV